MTTPPVFDRKNDKKIHPWDYFNDLRKTPKQQQKSHWPTLKTPYFSKKTLKSKCRAKLGLDELRPVCTHTGRLVFNGVRKSYSMKT